MDHDVLSGEGGEDRSKGNEYSGPIEGGGGNDVWDINASGVNSCITSGDGLFAGGSVGGRPTLNQTNCSLDPAADAKRGRDRAH